jgi:hypothetical protein
MSWWDTNNDDDVIGDQPADLVRHSLQQVAAAQKPALDDLLSAVGAVVKSAEGKEMLEKVPPKLHGISAVLKSGETVSAKPEGEGTPDLVRSLTENLRAIRDVYKERWERNPRLSEWLAVLAFVLRYRPEDFLADGKDRAPGNLTVAAG